MDRNQLQDETSSTVLLRRPCCARRPNRTVLKGEVSFYNVNKCERSERNTGVHLIVFCCQSLFFDGFLHFDRLTFIDCQACAVFFFQFTFFCEIIKVFFCSDQLLQLSGKLKKHLQKFLGISLQIRLFEPRGVSTLKGVLHHFKSRRCLNRVAGSVIASVSFLVVLVLILLTLSLTLPYSAADGVKRLA